MAKKAGARITRPLLASYVASLSSEGLPRVRLDYVTDDADVFLGPHQELWLTLNPVQAIELAQDLVRLADESREAIAKRSASARQQSRD